MSTRQLDHKFLTEIGKEDEIHLNAGDPPALLRVLMVVRNVDRVAPLPRTKVAMRACFVFESERILNGEEGGNASHVIIAIPHRANS